MISRRARGSDSIFRIRARESSDSNEGQYRFVYRAYVSRVYHSSCLAMLDETAL